MLRRILSRVFNYDPRYRTRTTRRLVERRVPRYESPRQTPERIVDEWSEEFIPELDNASDVQRLEEEERYQRSRTTELSVKSGGVLQKTEGSGDLDYTMKEHFFSPLNPNNR